MRTVTVQEMQMLDRKAIEELGIPSIVLMENAGKSVSQITLNILGNVPSRKVSLFCGTGKNGGDGFVAARYLTRQGTLVNVYIIGRISDIKEDPAINLNILQKMKVPVNEISSPIDVREDLIIDAIFGIGLQGMVREPARSIIKDLNEKIVPIISVDIPSGLNADTGEILGDAVKATKTVTMQFPKKGLYINKGPEYSGEIIVADIGI